MVRYIYALTEPDSGAYRYVGASRNPERRRIDHMKDRNRAPRLRVWLDGLRAHGLRPGLLVLREVQSGESWRVVEAAAIRDAILAGCDLLNVHDALTEPERCRAAVVAAVASGVSSGPELLKAVLETTNTKELSRCIGVSRALIFAVLEGDRLPSHKLVDALEQLGVPRASWPRISRPMNQGARKHRRSAPNTSKWLEHNGERMSCSAWARKLGIARETIVRRARRGRPIDMAIAPEVPRSPYRCALCKRTGHNRVTCTFDRAAIAAE